MRYSDIIQGTLDNRSLWNYYSDFGSEIRVKSVDDCKEFIDKFFSKAGKSGCIDFLLNGVDVADYRYQHIVYTFLFGIYMYNHQSVLKQNIDAKIDDYKEKSKCKSDVSFLFLWFLICFFHDLGYVYEDGRSSSLEDAIEATAQHKKRLIEVPSCYENVYKQYIYRKDYPNDHGILGGVMMYKTLCYNRKEQESLSMENRFLSWDKKLEYIYQITSSIVICHNMRFGIKGTEDEKTYAKYNIEGLLKKDGEYWIDYKKHPLFFLFCLIDSIEPYKVFQQQDPMNLIVFDVELDKIIVKVEEKGKPAEKYITNCESVNSWLTRAQRNGNQITIEINY